MVTIVDKIHLILYSRGRDSTTQMTLSSDFIRINKITREDWIENQMNKRRSIHFSFIQSQPHLDILDGIPLRLRDLPSYVCLLGWANKKSRIFEANLFVDIL